MAYDGAFMSDLAFGDFNADGKSDVLAVQYRGPGSNYYWAYSSGGVAGYADLGGFSTASAPLLGFGRFDAGTSTDILTAIETPYGSGKYPTSTRRAGSDRSSRS